MMAAFPKPGAGMVITINLFVLRISTAMMVLWSCVAVLICGAHGADDPAL
ncbi:MAG: hypothetical protein H7A44_05010 [Opitutaceae bacterium]|nr:hypothetical protein [Opitutaceae bacterium]